jgi:mono/diheme cytochrome c family protein
MIRTRIVAALTTLLLASAASSQAPPTAQVKAHDPAKVEFFEKKVRPILADHCYHCHSADTKPAGNLRVDDRNGLLSGGSSGPAVVPGEPEKSLLLKRVAAKDGKKRMPLEGKHLTDEEIADLTRWIKDGAAWPAVRLPASLGKLKPEFEVLKKEHWAWQPLTNPKPPAPKSAGWARDDIDRFVLAKLEAAGLKPVGDADRLTLIRRLTFDLTGLPPTPAEIESFVHDTSATAYEKVVDRLLASPAFGERWGRHWLDVARYGESTGPSRNIPYPYAWKYRDYVIDSVNADVPFDRFIQEQIAGDLLPAASNAERDRLLTATGFLALGVKDVNQRFKVRFVMDNVDEQIDAVSRSVLALTVSCARCHDHKFDPIPTTNYYALAGIFTSTDNCAGVRNKMGGGGMDYYDPSMLVKLTTAPPQAPAEQLAKLKVELDQAKKEWDAIRGTPGGLKVAADGAPTQRPFRLKYEKLQAEYAALSDPVSRGYAVHGVRDAQKVADTELRVRGEAEKLGPTIPRGFLTTFEVPGAAPVNPRQSGRLELAQWLTNPKNPLSPRVAANRIWQHLFGEGIVSTVDNFGVMGATPSHPELLDYLANRFIAGGWSIKTMVRAIVLSHTYQLASTLDFVGAEGKIQPASSAQAGEFRNPRTVDPANRLLWRHSPRRLSSEEIRDAALLAAGTLSNDRPKGSPAQDLKMMEMRDNGPEARTVNEKADNTTCRSVYLPLLRGWIPHSLEAFDPVEQTLVTGSRDATTVPSQALFMLNSSFVRQQALAMAERLLKDSKATDEARIGRAYQLAFGRLPNEKELARARAFIGQYESDYRAQLEKNPPPKTPAPKKQQPAPKKADKPPVNPDEMEQTAEPFVESAVRPKDARTAAWLAFTQALFGAAEFRYLR